MKRPFPHLDLKCNKNANTLNTSKMMTWKINLTLFLSLCFSVAFGQLNLKDANFHGCGSPAPTKEQIKYTLDVVDNLTLTRSGQMIYLPIRVHVVTYNDGTGGVDLGDVNSAVANLNQQFEPMDVGFYIADINTIANSAYADLDLTTEENDLAYPNVVPDAINMFFTERLTQGPYDICGYAFYPTDNIRSLRIFVRNECTNDADSGTIPHEMGHFFNLFHTFNGTSNGPDHYNAENVARTGSQANCSTHGDFLCDTNADPRGSINGDCTYLGSDTDIYGQPYSPPIGNMMSYYNKNCGAEFTPQQYQRMALSLQDRLSHTSYTLTNPIYSDVAYPTNVSAQPGQNYSIDITWNDVSNNETGFIVERSEDNGQTFSPIPGGGVAPNVSTFCDENIQSNQAYKYRVKPSNGDPVEYGASNIIVADLTYCVPDYQPTSCDILDIGVGMQRFKLGQNQLDNYSGCAVHSVYDGQVIPVGLSTGDDHPFTVEFILSEGQYVEQNIAIWIDLNRDGDFDDTNEMVYQSDYLTFGTQVINDVLSVPDCIEPGPTTLRVRSKYLPYGKVEDPCEFYHFGESEDYPVTIIQSESDFASINILEYSGDQDHDGLLCTGDQATLIAAGGVNYLWDNGATGATRIVSETGIYSVTVNDGNNCSATEVIAVEFNTYPEAQIIMNDGSGQTSQCDGSNVTLTASGGLYYQWDNGSTQATRVVTQTGNYRVTVSNGGGCEDIEDIIVTIGQPVIANILVLENSGQNSNDGILCQGDVANLMASGGQSYLWDNGSTSSERQVSTTGNYSVTVTNADGCSAIENVSITIGGQLNTEISISENSGNSSDDGRLCYGDSALLVASGGQSYLWDNGSTSAQRTVSTPDNYAVTIYNAEGCSQVETVTIHVENNMITGLQAFENSGQTPNDGILCSGDEATLVATGGLSYLWSDGITSNSRIVNESGTYSVEAFNAEGCSKTNTIDIVVSNADFGNIEALDSNGNTLSSPAICTNSSLLLRANGGVDYTWNTGVTASEIIISNAGTYTVEIIDSNGCSNTKSIIVDQINDDATIVSLEGVDLDQIFCPGESINLMVAGAQSTQWNTGNGNPVLSVNTGGTYTASVVTSNGCVTTVSTTIQYADSSIATITVEDQSGNVANDGILCQGDNAILIAPNAAQYAWSTGSNAPQISVTESDVYRVTITNQQGCTSEGSIYIDVENAMSADILVADNSGSDLNDGIICEGATVTLTAVGGNSYLWSTGSQANQITVSEAGNYSVEVMSNAGCSAIANTQVTVTTEFSSEIVITDTSGEFANDGVLCQGDQATLSIPDEYQVVWENGLTSNTRVVDQAGVYTASITNANGCSTQASATIQTNTIASGSIQVSENSGVETNDGVICSGDQAILSVQGNNILWENGSTSNQRTVTESGIYTATLTNASGCETIISTEITVTELPEPAIEIIEDSGIQNNDGILCAGDEAILRIQSENVIWENGVTTNERTIVASGIYTAIVQNANGCSTEISTEVIIEELPAIAVNVSETSGNTNNDGILCAGDIAYLMVSGGESILWSDGANSREIAVTQSGEYSVQVFSASGCVTEETIELLFIEEATTDLNIIDNSGAFFNDGVICAGDYANLIAQNGEAYLWSDGSTDAQLQVAQSGTYTVTITNANGCEEVHATQITVGSELDAEIQMTNAFGQNVEGPICAGEGVYLSLGDNLDIQWMDGNTQNPRYVTSSGLYTATVSSNTGCSSEAAIEVTIQENLNAEINIVEFSGLTNHDGVLCLGDAATLTAQGGVHYQWSNGSFGSEIEVTDAGLYSVIISDEAGCTATTEVEIIYDAIPQMSIVTVETSGAENNDGIICSGDDVVLTVTGGNTISWEDGSTLRERKVTEAGFYSVEVFSTQGCKVVGVVEVVVNSTVETGLLINGQENLNTYAGCSNETIEVSAFGGITYVWNDGVQQAARFVETSGTYSVVITDENGCDAVYSVDILIDQPIEAAIAINETSGTANNDGILCYGDSAVIAVQGGTSYEWNTGSTSPTITVESSGTYVVTVYNQEGCSTTEEVVIEFNQSSESSIEVTETSGVANDGILCYGEVATLQVVGGANPVWEDGYAGSIREVTESGIYRVVTENQTGCATVAEVEVEFMDAIEARIDIADAEGNVLEETTFCEGDFATLTIVSNTGIIWEDGSTATERTVNKSGTYTAISTNSNGCTESTSINVTFESQPEARILSNDQELPLEVALCYGETIDIMAQGGSEYNWNDGSQETTRTINTAGEYRVTVTNASGCEDIATVNVSYEEELVATIMVIDNSGSEDNDGIVCAGESATLRVVGGVAFQWNTGETSNTLQVNESGNYSVIVTAASGCTTSVSQEVIVNEAIVKGIIARDNAGEELAQASACVGEKITLEAFGGSQYAWSTGSIDSEITINTAGEYAVTITDIGGCESIESYTATFEAVPEITFDIVNQDGQEVYDGILAFGDVATVTARGADNFIWSDGTEGATITIATDGYYTVTGSNTNGCEAQGHVALYFSIILSNNTISLFGESEEQFNTLSWTMASDMHLQSYTLERKVNDDEFEAIYTVDAEQSDLDPIYVYEDADLQEAGDYYYRVRMETITGAELSEIITLFRAESTQLEERPNVTVFPNPSTGPISLKIEKYDDAECAINMIVRNEVGLVVAQEILAGDQFEDVATYTTDLSQLIPGIYFIEILRCNTKEIQRLIITD